METILVKTTKTHTYGGVVRQVGESYEMETRFLLAMSRMGNVERADEPDAAPQPQPQSQNYKTRALKAKR